MPEKPDHKDYYTRGKYKCSDRSALKSKRRKQLETKTEFEKRKWAAKQVIAEKRKPIAIAFLLGCVVQTIYRWVKVAKQSGYLALQPKSRRPYRITSIPVTTVNRILQAWETYHHCGCERLAYLLGDVSHMTVYRVLVRYGKLGKGKFIRRRWRFFERKHPNSMWQIDLKTVSVKDSKYTISIIDDHSRFIVGCQVFNHVPTTENVIRLLEMAIRTYGYPREILTDHGAQFYCNKGEGIGDFDMWCSEHGIVHILASVRKPTTIGKVERWHRVMIDELLSRLPNLEELEFKLSEFIRYYNFVRPHFGYYRYEIQPGVWHRKKIVYIPAHRFWTVLTERGIIDGCNSTNT